MNRKKKKNNLWRLLSILLCLTFLIGIMGSLTTFAEETNSAPPVSEISETGTEESQELEESPIEEPLVEPNQDLQAIHNVEECDDTCVLEGCACSYHDGTDSLPENKDVPTATIASVSSVNPVTMSDASPDQNYILVSKTFDGILPEQIPSDFAVTVQPQGRGSTYILKKNNASISQDGLTWQWQIDNVGTGYYMVSESGQYIDSYSLTTSATGTVEVKAATFDVDYEKWTTCNHTNWPVGITGTQNVMFAAALTGANGCVVISKEALTATQRATVASAITGIGGNWKNPVYFYSIAANGNGPWTIQNRQLHYDPATHEIILHATSDWTHVASVSYNILEATNPDIAIINAYSRLTVPVMIQKRVTGNMGDTSRDFSFTVTSSETISPSDHETYTLSDDGKTAFFLLSNGESVTLNDIFCGSILTITEDTVAGYETTVNVGATPLSDKNGSYTYVIPENVVDPIVISVINTKDIIIDTGISLDRLPYIIILIMSAVVIVWLVVHRQRRQHFD